MDYLVSRMGDVSPDTSRIILPVGITTEYMFSQYKRDRPTQERVKESQFYALWKANFTHVSHQKVAKF